MKFKSLNIDFFHLVIAMALSGNQALTTKSFYESLLVFFAVYLSFYYFQKTIKNIKYLIWVLIPFLLIFSFQILNFEILNLVTYAGFIVKLYIGFILVTSIKNFPKLYVKVLKFLVVLSFIFFIPSLFYPNFYVVFSPLINIVDATSEYRINIGLHNFTGYRNSGFFWEPGAFAGYIILSIIFLFVSLIGSREKIQNRTLIILVAGIVSTLSTTGYIALSVIIILYFRYQMLTNRNKLIKLFMLLIIPTAFLLLIYAFVKFDFLYEKITMQYESTVFEAHGWQITRFGTFLFDFDYIKDRPLTGWGFHSSTRFSKSLGDEVFASGMGNGMSDFIAKTGVLMFIYFCFLIFRWLQNSNISKWESLSIIVVFIILLQGEVFFNFPIFLGLYFLKPSQIVNSN